jgi:hypothetical protein
VALEAGSLSSFLSIHGRSFSSIFHYLISSSSLQHSFSWSVAFISILLASINFIVIFDTHNSFAMRYSITILALAASVFAAPV